MCMCAEDSFLEIAKEKGVVVWGGGLKCLETLWWLSRHNVNVRFIVDSDANKFNSMIENKPIIRPDDFFKNYADCFVVISTDKYSDEIISVLKSKGISNFAIFSELDLIGRDNDRCRESWIVERLERIEKGKKILDAGAGELRYKPYCKHLDYVSQDLCQYDGTGNQGLQTGSWDTSKIDIISDIIDIPVEDESFDVILCTEVLEHIKAPALAIKEMSRILRKDGYLILTAPFCSLTHFAPYHYSTGFGIYWYREVLKECGLTIQEETCNGNYFSYLAQEMRRLESVANKYSEFTFDTSDRQLITSVLCLLDKMNVPNNKSDELLCFGWQIVAKKTQEGLLYTMNS